MSVLSVVHKTVYRYRQPVSFGEHRLMLRPRDSHDMKILETSLATTPGAQVRWVHDIFGNSTAVMTFDQPSDRLMIDSQFTIEHFPQDADLIFRTERTEMWPVAYHDDEGEHLALDIARRYPDEVTEGWAAQFVGTGDGSPMDFLSAMAQHIRANFVYQARHTPGTQRPEETLTCGSGTCRDFALLMMEACRSQGFACRFVTGYLYDPALDVGDGYEEVVGAGATHAWVQVFLPEAGWVEFDPTNGIIGGQNLIRVAAVRDPAQAIPVAGSFYGSADDYLGMDVEVAVTKMPECEPVRAFGR
jgi:transglutaminase-like putative cysteine protease